MIHVARAVARCGADDAQAVCSLEVRLHHLVVLPVTEGERLEVRTFEPEKEKDEVFLKAIKNTRQVCSQVSPYLQNHS